MRWPNERAVAPNSAAGLAPDSASDLAASRRDLVDVSEQVCRLRPVAETLSSQEKKRPKRSAKKSRAK